ncbi:MAG: arginine decarboxylase [Verrucomicrobiales bacterium]|nr:arginine decarboxylase [Verrucomicrobiales bacterium]|tara:strand:+ start:20646 stop:22580 length:1935 start_codon:yes stop_codon:yes gene_type:complete
MSDAGQNGTWSVEDAASLYNVDRWGAGYFGVNTRGRVEVRPLGKDGAEVEVLAVVEEARKRGLRYPMLLRFQDIVRHRVAAINGEFRASMERHTYGGRYRGVFPVKVNQLREVVEEIVDAGRPFDFGLEVGSRAELFAALALLDDPGSLIICNGYKDEDFIRGAFMGLRLGKQVVLVIEKLEELPLILRLARESGVEPMVGMRLKLLSRSAGKWADSGGEDAKFGLTTADLVAAADLLRREGLSRCLRLLHFHIGSQVPDILTVKKAVQEGARFYAKLRKMDFPIEYLDVGGGLAVDYDGSRAAGESSSNYTLREYTDGVVGTIGGVCDEEEVPAPDVVSESGRAIVAHHSVLVVEAFGAIAKSLKPRLQYGDEEHALVRKLLKIRRNFGRTQNKLAAFHGALQCKEDAHDMFTLGVLELDTKAKVETLYWEICGKVTAYYRGREHVPEEIVRLMDSMGDQYVCNFSVFQSLQDHWALDQLFPIMPLGRLDERPTREARLVDITCDSDGAVKKFIDLEAVRDTLPLHALRRNGKGMERYPLGIFLTGAYQDIMGDMHNLFGSVHEVHVFLDPDEASGYYVEEVIRGHTVVESLNTVQYDEKQLKRWMKQQVDAAIKADRLKPSQAMKLLDEYDRGLRDYTYLSV